MAAALAQAGPLLVVTATGREADDLTAELRAVLGDAVALFPSWETLPHERLSPGVETVGARLLVLRRLANPDDARLGPPLQVVVTTARSLLQPMAPGLADIEPVTLTVGSDVDLDGGFEGVIVRLVELAYTRVDMVGKRGEFAVRGGILDVFPPTAEHPVRAEFWGDEVTELRMFSVADQRSIPEAELDTVVAVPCRELLLTDDVRERAAALAVDLPARDNRITGTVGEMLAKLADGIPVDGMEALLPVLRPTQPALLYDQLPAGTPAAGLRSREGAHQGGRPDQDGQGVPRGVVVGGGDRRGRPDRRRASRWLGLPRARRGAHGRRARRGTRGGR